MEKINDRFSLEEIIREVELKRTLQLVALQNQFECTLEALKPSILIQNTLEELMASPQIKIKLTDTILAHTSGIIANKLAVGNSHNPIQQIFGYLLQLTVTNQVSKNAGDLRSFGGKILQKLFHTSEDQTPD